MPKILEDQAFEMVLSLVPSQAPGLGLDALAQAWARSQGQDMARRTLQRRLAVLVQRQQLNAIGRGRALRYVRSDLAGLLAQEPSPQDKTVSVVHVSDAGLAIQQHVRQPRALRQPVGYQVSFLTSYQPNVSAYLPKPVRDQLHLLGQPQQQPAPAGTYEHDILQRLLIDLSWASSQLEGNTYSRLDTERLIQRGEVAEGKNAFETQMILNHKDAIEYLVHQSQGQEITTDSIIALHAFLSNGLMSDPMACGRMRSRPVDIGGSVYLPMSMPQQLDELFGLVVAMARDIQDPFEQAFFLMVHLPYLQPFEDVNKRVSRLAANMPLIRLKLCPLSFVDVPQQDYVNAMLGVYELNRIELLRDVFVWAYERSCQHYLAVQQNLKTPDLFRLRHWTSLVTLVQTLVTQGLAATETHIAQHMPADVPAEAQARFTQLALEEFRSLHKGNVIRFGLRPLVWQHWLEQHRV